MHQKKNKKKTYHPGTFNVMSNLAYIVN